MNTESTTFETDGVRVAIEGCGHGTLDAIYTSVARSSKARGWDGVDLLIIGGDFEAVRNAADLSVMSVPLKYRELGDFWQYYNGEKKAPYLTLFIAGNHEASSYLWELYYGGWVAPNMYYLGAANVLRFGPLRIAGMSGIWKGHDYRKPHHERLPFNQDDIKSFYHVREIDVRKLLLLREPVDVGLSHDWPRAVENHGNTRALWSKKPDFRQESIDGVLGNPAAEYVMDRLRPAYWFSAHMHCKFTAIKKYQPPQAKPGQDGAGVTEAPAESDQAAANPDEIDLDAEDDEAPSKDAPSTEQPEPTPQPSSSTAVADSLRAQLPASFAAPKPKLNPGQPVPPSITNTTTRFLALDKCLPGRKFIQLLSLTPLNPDHLTQYPPSSPPPSPSGKYPLSYDPEWLTTTRPSRRYTLSYDPEWLAITRVFNPLLTIGDPAVPTPPDQGEAAYAAQIDAERAWVDEHVVRAGKLVIPENFAITAPPHYKGMPESTPEQPEEYTNPQTGAFCELVGVRNWWDASPEERAERKARGPPPSEFRGGDGAGGGGNRGRGGGRGRGRGRGRGGGGGRGRGGRGRGRGKGFGGWR
ncbi:lariat debranching enzyme, C-terminal domain-containing protein [Xylaria bambusicola]|uniref:lariat debranching enzyme, C-terminal domain-containing protein n=1 Tax=Xylaria bambusicola TaxID=326684 RepID=UPI00200780C8|nr:lariat debranching enzyme, C-terminal domain-containing protein [Xylaria bambusicola]KAI0503248.1 lariat debranching enzyme, C-terminal domain-containing protein [Xylaria bambusicola]